jgi:two-component system sensor histidine kinase KdpD
MGQRGRLRVYLGAAPGVGKTFAMLDEGNRRRARGTDVVAGFVETHGRPRTAEAIDGLEVVPRLTRTHRDAAFTEFDLDGVLVRRPQVVLVDELAHTNVPGGRHAKRWQDVEELLAAGIDVITTVNVQHLESLNDVVEKITGVAQRETVPDEVVRAADQIELVDMSPESLRRRMAHGNIYAPEKVDAALSRYFRVGNLTALRELALLWLADQVDDGLQQYREAHGIHGVWEARERVVVALTGGPEGETLIRRAARIAARSTGGDLLALHVNSADGLTGASPSALVRQRQLVESLGGTYHSVIGDRVPEALIEFARAENATQFVVGSSRRGRVSTFLTGPGIGQTVARLSGDIDVHLVGHDQAAGGRRLPSSGGGLTPRRRLLGALFAAVLVPALALSLIPLRNQLNLTSEMLLLLLAVVAVALVGGSYPAIGAAVAASLFLNYYFTEPTHTFTIARGNNVLAFVVFLVVAVTVSSVVDLAARRTRAATRANAEAETLAILAGSVLRGQDAVPALVERLREAFGMRSVTLCVSGEVIASAASPAGPATGTAATETSTAAPAASPAAPAASPAVAATYPATHATGPASTATGSATPATGPASADFPEEETDIPVGSTGVLKLRGRALAASDRRMLAAFAAHAAVALEQRRLAEEAAKTKPLAEADRMRSALLNAVSHDLRTPLAAARAAVTSLRSSEVDWNSEQRAELIATADESLDRLVRLVENLLDMSRLQAGVLTTSAGPAALDEVVPRALDELGPVAEHIALAGLDAVPRVAADPVLLERVVANLVGNALRYSPPGHEPKVSASSLGDQVELRVADQGPGIPAEDRERVFLPFQRLGDTDNSSGVGLGLALSRGLTEAMSGTLSIEDTPGGGLTMVVSLTAVRERPGPADERTEL